MPHTPCPPSTSPSPAGLGHQQDQPWRCCPDLPAGQQRTGPLGAGNDAGNSAREQPEAHDQRVYILQRTWAQHDHGRHVWWCLPRHLLFIHDAPHHIPHFVYSVRWHVTAVGNEVDLHTAHWHGLTFNHSGSTVDEVLLLPGSVESLETLIDSPSTWLLHCHVNDHIVRAYCGWGV